MIAIEEKADLLEVAVYGELSLGDYRRLEVAVSTEIKTGAPKVKLLLDLTRMTGFTLDVAWEEVKFTRAHAHDFRRIAIITPDQWGPWISWVSAAFTDAEVMLFEDLETAEEWLQEKK